MQKSDHFRVRAIERQIDAAEAKKKEALRKLEDAQDRARLRAQERAQEKAQEQARREEEEEQRRVWAGEEDARQAAARRQFDEETARANEEQRRQEEQRLQARLEEQRLEEEQDRLDTQRRVEEARQEALRREAEEQVDAHLSEQEEQWKAYQYSIYAQIKEIRSNGSMGIAKWGSKIGGDHKRRFDSFDLELTSSSALLDQGFEDDGRTTVHIKSSCAAWDGRTLTRGVVVRVGSERIPF